MQVSRAPVALLAWCILLQSAVAKPPPPAGAPWAAYVTKPGAPLRRDAAAVSDGDSDTPADYEPPMNLFMLPMGYPPIGNPAMGFPPGLAFNPIFAPPAPPSQPISPANPMAPFMKLKPSLPAKPTFMPPFVDPGKFIDMKADLLNNLFAKGAVGGPSLATRSMGPPPFVGASKFAGGPAPFAKMGGPPPFVASKIASSPFGAGAAPFGKKAAFFGSVLGADDPTDKAERALMSPFAMAGPAPEPEPVTSKPAPPFLADLFKALGINKTVANATDGAAPAGMWGPVSPFAPPMVAPGAMISTKAKFLSDLFSSLGIPTTPAPAPETTTTGSIVPPDFWVPETTSGLIDPAAYTEKVSTFLDKLFNSLNISTDSATAASSKRATPETDPKASETEKSENLKYLLEERDLDRDQPEDEIEASHVAKRSADSSAQDDPAALLADAKDKVVDTIIAELSSLKNSMVGAVTDLAQAQKDAAIAAAAAAKAAAPKKPLKPGPPMSPYAAMWAKPGLAPPSTTPAPTPIPVEPVQQRVALLGQVFDMLTAMEKDITSAMVVPPSAEATSPAPTEAAGPGADFLDAVNAKLHLILNMSSPLNATPSAPVSATRAPVSSKMARLVTGTPPPPFPVDPTFWIPDSLAATGPDAYLSKTSAFLSKIMAAKATAAPATDAPTMEKRSYKPYKYYQQQQPDQQQQQQQQQQEGFNGQDNKMAQGSASVINAPLMAGLAKAEYFKNHHHHHNRQPYWWN